MTLSYYARLLCVCCATFFLVHALSWIIVSRLARAAVAAAGKVSPRSAARLLFVLRMAPVALALLFVVGFCVPSYVWFEPHVAGERVSFLFLLAALVGLFTFTLPLLRGAMAIFRTWNYLRACSRHALNADVAQPDSGPLVISEDSALMATAGIVCPRVVVSQAVMDALSEEQKEAAFRHEAAHLAARDNLKKLLFLLTPDLLPLVPGGCSILERGWALYSEWAADDEAVDGDVRRAVSLASALVRIAKIGVRPRPSYLLSSFVDDERGLAMRVDRLLHGPLEPIPCLTPNTLLGGKITLLVALTSGVLLFLPLTLAAIHRLLERLLQ